MMERTKHLYEFGPFRLDPIEHLLLRDGEPVPVSPTAFEILVVLVQNSGHLFEKDELMKKVWGGTAVEEANLTVHVSILRRALGEDSTGHRYIETVPKRGYRFIATVSEVQRYAAELIVEEFTEAPNLIEEKHETIANNAFEQASEQKMPSVSNGKQSDKQWFSRAPILTWSVAMLCVMIGIVILWRGKDQPKETPQLNNITVLTKPVSGRQFIVEIDGGGFDPNSVRAVSIGPGCPNFGSCVVPNDALKQFGSVTYAQIERVPLTLGPGDFLIFVQNGPTGPHSEGKPLSVQMEINY